MGCAETLGSHSTLQNFSDWTHHRGRPIRCKRGHRIWLKPSNDVDYAAIRYTNHRPRKLIRRDDSLTRDDDDDLFIGSNYNYHAR